MNLIWKICAKIVQITNIKRDVKYVMNLLLNIRLLMVFVMIVNKNKKIKIKKITKRKLKRKKNNMKNRSQNSKIGEKLLNQAKIRIKGDEN